MSEFDVTLLSFGKSRPDRPDLVTVSYDGREVGHHEADYDTWEARSDGTLSLMNGETGDLWWLWFDVDLATTEKFPSRIVGAGKIDPNTGRISMISNMVKNCSSAESRRVVVDGSKTQVASIKIGERIDFAGDGPSSFLVGSGAVSMSSLTIRQPTINDGDDESDDLAEVDFDDTEAAEEVPQFNCLHHGITLNQPLKNPARVDGFIITEAGRDEMDRIYVVADCALSGKSVRLTSHDITEVETSEIDRAYAAMVERLTAERDDAKRQLDAARKVNRTYASRISNLEDRLAKLTPAETEPEHVQPAEVGSMGQPRLGRSYRW